MWALIRSQRSFCFLGIGFVLACSARAIGGEPPRRGGYLDSFDSQAPTIEHRSPHVKYDIDLAAEKFFIYVPPNYRGTEAFGLIVFIYAGDQFDGLPPGWESVLARRKLLLVAAQNSGNDHDDARRSGLAVLGALKMSQKCKVDPQRIYAAGHSGGARVAGKLAFRQSDLIRGTIQCCGADFYEPVPQVKAQRDVGQYGLFTASNEEIESARKNVRFVFITGVADFRYGNLSDIYHGGYAKAGFQAKFLDVPGMGHALCDDKTLSAALDFLEAKTSGASAPREPVTPSPLTRPTAPAPQPATPPRADTTTADADRAASALQMAKTMVSMNRLDAARQRLEDLIAKYPTTPAATEAKALLKDIRGK